MPIKDPVKLKEYKKKYYKSNRTKILTKSVIWKKKNKLKVHESYKRNYETSKDSQLRKDFGITLNQYKHMLQEQKGLCAICEKPETVLDGKYKRLRALAVDHCHITGKIRKLLCSKCNPGLGYFQDNSELLLKAVAYLKTA